MDYNRINEFVVLAKHMNFKDAAAELQISPATLSARIMALEKNMNHQLICHKSHSVQLTESGSLFLEDARGLLSDYKTALLRIHQVPADIPHSLSIAVAGTGMPPRLESALIELCTHFPNLHLSIADDSMYSIQNGLQSGKIDLYFAYMDSSRRSPDLRRYALFSSPLCILLPRTHKLAHKSTIHIREMDGETFCLYPQLMEPALHDLELQILENSGIHYKILDTASSKTFYQNTVGSGLCVALCPWVLQDHIPTDVIAIPLANNFTYTMYMLYSRQNTSPLVHTFINNIRKLEF